MKSMIDAGALAKQFGNQARRQTRSDEAEEGRNGGCGAYGCPLPGSLSTGGETRYCGFHFGAGIDANDRITQWLRAHPAVVEALHATEAWSMAQMDALALRMTEAGFADLAPTTRVIRHEGYGRYGTGIEVTRDERDHPKLYVQRLRGAVAQRIAAAGATMRAGDAG
jgi:hypothetical protein